MPVAGVKLLLLLEVGAADVPVSGVKPPAASNDCTSSNCVAIRCARARSASSTSSICVAIRAGVAASGDCAAAFPLLRLRPLPSGPVPAGVAAFAVGAAAHFAAAFAGAAADFAAAFAGVAAHCAAAFAGAACVYHASVSRTRSIASCPLHIVAIRNRSMGRPGCGGWKAPTIRGRADAGTWGPIDSDIERMTTVLGTVSPGGTPPDSISEQLLVGAGGVLAAVVVVLGAGAKLLATGCWLLAAG